MTEAAAQPAAATAAPTTTAYAVVEALAAEIEQRRARALEAKIQARPKAASWASQVSPCNRQNVYSILQWDQRRLHDTRLQARFDAGNDQEHIVLRQLNELGFDVVEAQAPLERSMAERYLVSGRIDGKVRYMGHRIPLEVKSCHPRVFGKLENLGNADAVAFIRGDEFLSGHLRQFSLYLLGHNEEAGLILYTDCLGHWKLVVVGLDYGLAESVLQQLELVKAHVQARTLPDRIPYDEGLCGRCAFQHVCLPDMVRQPTLLVDDAADLAALDRRAELDPLAVEWEMLDKALKEKYRGQPRSIIGGKWVAESKASMVRGKEQWRTTFKPLAEVQDAAAAQGTDG